MGDMEYEQTLACLGHVCKVIYKAKDGTKQGVVGKLHRLGYGGGDQPELYLWVENPHEKRVWCVQIPFDSITSVEPIEDKEEPC